MSKEQSPSFNLEEDIEKQLNLAAKVFKYTIEGIIVTDMDGKIQMVNKAFEDITGFSAEEAIGKNPRILKSGKQKLEYYQSLWKALDTIGQWQGEIINRRKNGEFYYQRTTIATIMDNNGNPTSYCSIFSDITEQKEAEQKLTSDLELARQIQKSVLSKPIHNDLISIDGHYLPSQQLAGDMYAWYQISDHQYGVILFDVMGHGVASSLICMSIRSLLRGVIQSSVCPNLVFKQLNDHMRALYRENEGEDNDLNYFFTCIYIVIDFEKKELEYASAGHLPGMLIKANKEVTYLNAGCPPIGILPQLEVETGKLLLEGGERIFLYTDGLVDAFGIHTSENINQLKDIIIDLKEIDNSKLVDTVVNDIQRDHGSFIDDVTMIGIHIHNM